MRSAHQAQCHAVGLQHAPVAGAAGAMGSSYGAGLGTDGIERRYV
jgi:hypothetical protein